MKETFPVSINLTNRNPWPAVRGQGQKAESAFLNGPLPTQGRKHKKNLVVGIGDSAAQSTCPTQPGSCAARVREWSRKGGGSWSSSASFHLPLRGKEPTNTSPGCCGNSCEPFTVLMLERGACPGLQLSHSPHPGTVPPHKQAWL